MTVRGVCLGVFSWLAGPPEAQYSGDLLLHLAKGILSFGFDFGFAAAVRQFWVYGGSICGTWSAVAEGTCGDDWTF